MAAEEPSISHALVSVPEVEDESRSDALFFLGRRLERLFFGGIALIAACFVAASLATVNKQLVEDHSSSALVALLQRVEADEPHLTALAEAKPEPPPKPPAHVPRVVAPAGTKEQRAEEAETRRMLGLPPELPPPRPTPAPEPATAPQPVVKVETYTEALMQIVSDAAAEIKLAPSELTQYIDVKKSPKELIASLEAKRAAIDAKPTSLWGIQTPRALRLKYAEQDFNVPYGILLQIIIFPLAILVVGWHGAVYMTRQRELVLLAALEDYKLAFPHLLNFLPVSLERFFPPQKYSPLQNRFRLWLTRMIQLIIRLCVVLLLSVPMIFGLAYSIFVTWQAEGEPSSNFFLCAGLILVVPVAQMLALLAQEWLLLRKKNFVG